MSVRPGNDDTADASSPADVGQHTAADYRWLLAYIRPHRYRLAAVLGLSLVSTGLSLAQPYITKFLIDDGLIARQLDNVVFYSVLMLGLGLAAALLGAFNRWHYVSVSARILHALRESVFGHLLTLSPSYFARTQSGDILARLDGDIAEVQRFAVDTGLAFVSGVLALIGALALMLSLSPSLTALAFVVLPLNVFFLRKMRPRLERGTRSVRERASAITAFLVERLGAAKLIQSYSAEQREQSRLQSLNRVLRDDTLRLQMTNYATATVPGLVNSAGTAVVFIVGGYLITQGRLSIGTLIAFAAYLARANGPLQTLLGLYAALARARVSLDRVLAITRVAPTVVGPIAPRRLPSRGGGQVTFEGVSFVYPDNRERILDGLDLRLPAARKIALSGVSGAGKSTLIDLLQRHYDPTAGRILLDGIDLRELDLRQLRRRIVVVAQDAVLFEGSILDNLRYAAPEAGEQQLLDAARRARVDSFAQTLPEGYDTRVGTRGSALSGGQRQRIAIARALLLDPIVLVLDEATSAVDEANESEILDAVDDLFGNRTRIVISHRAATLRGAHLAFAMRAGMLFPLTADTVAHTTDPDRNQHLPPQ